MKYKTGKTSDLPGCPEWLLDAISNKKSVVCKNESNELVEIYGWDGYICNGVNSKGERRNWYTFQLTPITAWKPQEGEVVLAWSNKDISAFPMIFNEMSENRIWGKLTCTDDQEGQIGFWDSDNITPFSIELYTKPISEWPKDIEIIHVENIKEEAKENTW